MKHDGSIGRVQDLRKGGKQSKQQMPPEGRGSRSKQPVPKSAPAETGARGAGACLHSRPTIRWVERAADMPASLPNNDRVRSWVSLRQRLNEVAVASEEKGLSGIRNLPSLAALVASMKAEAQHTRPSAQPGRGAAVPVDLPLGETIPTARRLYVGPGSVRKLSSTALRGKRIISGPFGDRVATDLTAVDASGSKNGRATEGSENKSDDDETDEKKQDTADYLDFLSSAFMERLSSSEASKRREWQWKRSFEETLERRRQKQARTDEFFEIYRRTHAIESVASGFDDYLLLEAAYDVDFDEELRLMSPPPSALRLPASRLHARIAATTERLAAGSSPAATSAGITPIFDHHRYGDIRTDSDDADAEEPRNVKSASPSAERAEVYGELSASKEKRSRRNDGDFASGADEGIEEEAPRVHASAGEGIIDGVGNMPRVRSDGRPIAGVSEAEGLADRREDDGVAAVLEDEDDHWHPNTATLRHEGVAGIAKLSDFVGEGTARKGSGAEEGTAVYPTNERRSRCGSAEEALSTGSELTLGRPEPTSVHWKYSRRLLQTRTTPMALMETVVGEIELSLPHQSLGNTYIELISEVVKDLPGVTRLDLRDNRLTDVGVQEIVKAICNMEGQRGIQILDLSENKLDTVSANSLCAFLKSPTCCLREILLAKADIDDGETAIVMEAMKENRSVRHLDFSNNAIGGGYEKTQRPPGGPTTGGASIALALGLNSALRRINLQWNLLGPKSGVLLGRALAKNHTLEWLDVSYNAIGEDGAQAIGTALKENDGLVRLDLSYNEVSLRAVLVIAQALESNGRLEVLRLDGNSIGFDGGRTLVRSLNYWTLPRALGLNHCMLESRATIGDCFDPLFPTGRYSLDCSKPYDWAVAYELLRSASVLPGTYVRYLAVREHRLDKKEQVIKIVRPDGGVGVWKKLGQRLEQPDSSSGLPSQVFRARHVPACPSEMMDATEWRRELANAWVVDTSTGERFYPPERGIVEMDFVCHRLPPTGWSLINASGMQHLRALAEADEQCKALPLLYIKMAAKDLRFTTRQVKEIIRTSTRRLNSLQIQELLLASIPRLQDPECLRGLLEMHLEPKQISVLQRNFGQAFSAFTTCVSGHYSLDLSREVDREAAMRLSEWSHLDQMCLRALSGWAVDSGGTSQKGRWSSFRNERYRKQPINRGLTESFFKMGLADRVPGVLEFDFVSMARPPADTRPLTPLQFHRFLLECGLSHLASPYPPSRRQTLFSSSPPTTARGRVSGPRGGSVVAACNDFDSLLPAVNIVSRNASVAVSDTLLEGGFETVGVGGGEALSDKVKRVVPLSIEDAVRLKQTADMSERLKVSEAAATRLVEEETARQAATALPSDSASDEESSGRSTRPALIAGSGRGGGSSESSEDVAAAPAVTAGRGSTAAVRKRSLAAEIARQRLKKAARYAGAGLAMAPPFLVKASLGESSLEAFLSCGGVQWNRWPEGKLTALWGHLLAKDCAILDEAYPILMAHIVRVRICHGTEEKTLECIQHETTEGSLSASPSTANLSRGFIGRLVKIRGSQAGQDTKRVATSLVLDTFREFLSDEADVWLVKKDILESEGSPLCPNAPTIKQKIIEHLFDAYVDKLPNHEFAAFCPTAATTIAIATSDASRPEASAATEWKSTDNRSSRPTKGVGESGAVAGEDRGGLDPSTRGTDEKRQGKGNAADTTTTAKGAPLPDINGAGASPRYRWVAQDVGEAAPYTGVAGTSAAWAAAARDMRFRLANVWLCCEQGKTLAGMFPERVSGIVGSLREDLVAAMFGRITDLDNFFVVLETLSRDGQLSAARRLGCLNMLNPHHADRQYNLDLRFHDHRKVAGVLAEMAVVEPGPNLQHQQFSRHADTARHVFIPGWEMPVVWTGIGQSGVPDDGHFAVEYCSDEGMGCRADHEVRERLRRELFLCGVLRDKGIGVFGHLDEELARTLAEQPSL